MRSHHLFDGRKLQDNTQDGCHEPVAHQCLVVKDKILHFLSEEQVAVVTKLKQSFNKYSLNKILKYVYSKYPDMAKESQIKAKVLG